VSTITTSFEALLTNSIELARSFPTGK
jgi:hypothetical protein